MADQLLFTVIIPTHNRPAWLNQAIDSVLGQQFEDWELIVIDDGSNPPVRDRVSQYTDPRIRYVYQENCGLGLTRQRGVELSVGKFVCFLDDDDYYLPGHLDCLAKAYRVHGSDDCLFKVGTHHLYPDGKLQKGKLFSANRSALLQHWEDPEGIFPYAIPRRFAQKIPSLGFFLTEDFEWLGRLLLHLPVKQLTCYTIVCRLHSANRSRVLVSRGALTARLEAVDYLYAQEGMSDHIPKTLYHRMQNHQCLHWVRQCLRMGRVKEASYGVMQALKYPSRLSIKEWGYTGLVVLRSLFR